MKPVMFACLAMLIFAFVSVVIEQKLSGYTTVALMVYVYLVTLPLALGTVGFLKLTHQPIVIPTGSVMILAIAVGVGYYFGDFFFFSAYTSGGGVVIVGTVTLLFPVLASLVKFIWTGSLPNIYHVGSYFLAVGAVALTLKGSLEK